MDRDRSASSGRRTIVRPATGRWTSTAVTSLAESLAVLVLAAASHGRACWSASAGADAETLTVSVMAGIARASPQRIASTARQRRQRARPPGSRKRRRRQSGGERVAHRHRPRRSDSFRRSTRSACSVAPVCPWMNDPACVLARVRSAAGGPVDAGRNATTAAAHACPDAQRSRRRDRAERDLLQIFNGQFRARPRGHALLDREARSAPCTSPPPPLRTRPGSSPRSPSS